MSDQENVVTSENTDPVVEQNEDVSQAGDQESNDAPEGENETPENDDDGSDDGEKEIDELPLPGEDDDKSSKKSDLPKWAKKRLEKKEREIAEREAELERMREASESRQYQQFQQQDLKAPRREDFDSDEEFVDARYAYNQQKSAQEYSHHRRQQEMIESENKFMKRLKDAVDEAEKKYDDFDGNSSHLFQKNFPANRAMAESILDSDFSSDILKFLDQYPDHARKIAELNPVKAVKEIARLEARFVEKKKRNVTKSAKPLTPLNSNKTNSTSDDPNKMDPETFNKWYKAKYG